MNDRCVRQQLTASQWNLMWFIAGGTETAANLESTAGSFHNGHAERFSQRRVEEDVALNQNPTHIFVFQSAQQTHPVQIETQW